MLAHNHDELTVDLVAHSLGNRVVLRTLALLLGRSGLYVRRVVHMAAAVATWKLDEDEQDRLRAGLLSEMTPGSATSLYSGADWVLADVFPVGETVDLLSEGITPTALGHAKWVAGDGVGLDQQWATNAEHRDYWGGVPKTDRNVRDGIRDQVRAALALATSASYETPSHATPSIQPIDERTTEQRSTAVRASGEELAANQCACSA